MTMDALIFDMADYTKPEGSLHGDFDSALLENVPWEFETGIREWQGTERHQEKGKLPVFYINIGTVENKEFIEVEELTAGELAGLDDFRVNLETYVAEQRDIRLQGETDLKDKIQKAIDNLNLVCDTDPYPAQLELQDVVRRGFTAVRAILKDRYGELNETP